jgi:hypothetical protein
MMVITLSPDLETAIHEYALQRGGNAEEIAVDVLKEHFLTPNLPIAPRDEWERRLLALATPCGVSLSHEAVSSEGIY